jgi:hypothetical protein
MVTKNIKKGKRDYYAPCMTLIAVDAVSVLAQSVQYTDEKADGNGGILSPEYRGEWGNLWEKR